MKYSYCPRPVGRIYPSSNTIGWIDESMILLEIIKESTLIYSWAYIFVFISENKLYESVECSVNIFTGGPDYSMDNYTVWKCIFD